MFFREHFSAKPGEFSLRIDLSILRLCPYMCEEIYLPSTDGNGLLLSLSTLCIELIPALLFFISSFRSLFGLDSLPICLFCNSPTFRLQTRLLHTLEGDGRLTSPSVVLLQLLGERFYDRQRPIMVVDRLDLFLGHAILLLNTRPDISGNLQRRCVVLSQSLVCLGTLSVFLPSLLFSLCVFEKLHRFRDLFLDGLT